MEFKELLKIFCSPPCLFLAIGSVFVIYVFVVEYKRFRQYRRAIHKRISVPLEAWVDKHYSSCTRFQKDCAAAILVTLGDSFGHDATKLLPDDKIEDLLGAPYDSWVHPDTWPGFIDDVILEALEKPFLELDSMTAKENAYFIEEKLLTHPNVSQATLDDLIMVIPESCVAKKK